MNQDDSLARCIPQVAWFLHSTNSVFYSLFFSFFTLFCITRVCFISGIFIFVDKWKYQKYKSMKITLFWSFFLALFLHAHALMTSGMTRTFVSKQSLLTPIINDIIVTDVDNDVTNNKKCLYFR